MKFLPDNSDSELIDDRDEKTGVKFKDADLIGIPTQIIIGEKNLKNGLVEIKDRKTKEAIRVSIEKVIERFVPKSF